MNPKFIALALLPTVVGAIAADAQQIKFRNHDETTAGAVSLRASTENPGANEVSESTSGAFRVIHGNAIPNHLVGQFPNAGNPNQITPQDVEFHVTLKPKVNSDVTPLNFGWIFGIAVNGVAYDPLAAEFWNGNPRFGWSYNALGGAFDLGIDDNHAHVQGTGEYHYHGLPTGLLKAIGWSLDYPSPVVGYAADGFPIFSIVGSVDGSLKEMKSSYRLKSGSRPGGAEPDGTFDGAFNEDFEFVEGLGDLDECNGAMTVSFDYPDGTYAYFLTQEYPVVPRCFRGTPDNSFNFAPN